MERIDRWLAGRAAREQRRPTVESALLGGSFARYAVYRLTGFFSARVLSLGARAVELGVLMHLFAAKGVVTSLALQNLAALVDAFWWGALETMRVRGRAARSKGELQREVSYWLSLALRGAAAALLLPSLYLVYDCVRHQRAPSVLHAYAFLCGLRLAIDLLNRTFYSGVYARSRVFRPIYTILISEPLTLLSVVGLTRWVGPWAFPVALILSVVASRGLALAYALRAYRLLRLPRPVLRWRRRRPDGLRLRSAWASGFAYSMTRIGSMLVLGVLIGPLSGRPLLASLLVVLHMSAPLLGAASTWSLVFYHDFQRLADDAVALLRRRLERWLFVVAVAMALLLWLATLAVSLAFVGERELPALLALAPLYLVQSLLAALQIRDFARGQLLRLSLGALALAVSILVGLGLSPPVEVPRWIVQTAILFLPALLVAFLWRGRRATLLRSGVGTSLLAWARALSEIEGPVHVAWIQTLRASQPQRRWMAERVAAALVDGGAVVVLARGARVVWFRRGVERLAPTFLVAAAGGKLATHGAIAVEADGSRALAAAALAGAFAEPRSVEAAGGVAELRQRFTALVPEGLLVDVQLPGSTLTSLPPAQRRAVWRDAVRGSRRGSVAKQRSPFEVTSFRPAGEIALLFVIPRAVEAERRRAWRDLIDAANWRSSTTAGMLGAAVERTALEQRTGKE